MEYKGYTGSIARSHHDECFYGKIENIKDLVSYEAQTLEGLEKSFREAVDDYLEFCRELGKEPEGKTELVTFRLPSISGIDEKQVSVIIGVGASETIDNCDSEGKPKACAALVLEERSKNNE